MKIGLPYNRVSSERQVNEGQGLQSQNKRGVDYIKQQGYKLGRSFNDEGISGGVIDRPAMKELLEFLEEHKDDGNEYIVVVDDIKRLARNVQGHFTLKAAIYSRGAKLESPNHRFEDTPEGQFVETVLAGAAELERNQNKRQVMSRMKARAENGYWPFGIPMGLINKKDPIHGKILIPFEPYASVLKIAIEKYACGLLHKVEDVRNCLYEEFKKKGIEKKPAMSTTQHILRNPLYAGYIEYKPWGIPFMKAQHEGFISLETYNAVQERLLGRTKPWKRKDHSRDFPLRPFVLCTTCDTPLTGNWNKGRSQRYANYYCRKEGCPYRWKTIRKEIFEGKFEELLHQVKPLADHVDLAKEVLKEQWNLRMKSYSEYRSSLLNEVRNADKGVQSYLELIRKAKDDELKSVYEKELKDFLDKKKVAEKDLSKKNYTSEQFGTASEKVFNTLKDPISMWRSDQYDDKRMVLYMYFEDQLTYDYKEGFGTANLAYPVKLIGDLGQAKKQDVEMSGNEPESEKY